MAYVKAADVDPLDPIVASRIQRIIDNQEDHETRIIAKVENIKNGHFVCPGSTGNYAVTGVGFTPVFLKFYTGLTSNGGINCIGQGQTDGTTQTAVVSGARVNASVGTSSGGSAVLTDCCIANPSIDTSGVWSATVVKATFVSFDADGFTVNFSQVNTARTIVWEAYGPA